MRPISRASTRLIACTSTFACYAAVRIPVVVSGPGRHAAGLRRCGILRGLGLTIGLMGAAALATSLDDPAPWAHAHKAAEALIDQAVGS